MLKSNNKIFWIASYPKSGNTWMRAFLSAYLYSDDGKFRDFSLLDKIIKFESQRFFSHLIKKDFLYKNETEIAKYWIKSQLEILKFAQSSVFLKTHNYCGSINNYNFTNADLSLGFVYLVRDPRSIAVSFSFHTEESIDSVIDSMVSEKPRYVVSAGYPSWYYNWKVNYFSWKEFSKKIPGLILKYEDLFDKNNFIKITKLIDNLGIYKFNAIKFNNAYLSTTFEKLNILEEKYGFDESGKSKFFNKGKKDYWKNVLNSQQIKRIEKNFEKEMLDLGYLS